MVADLASDASADLVVTCDVRVSGALRPAVRSVVVRLVQEALQNIRKHADADRASVEVAATNGSVRVAVRAEWETIGLIIFGSLAVLLIVGGVVRTVHRRRREAAEEEAAAETVEQGATTSDE